MEYIGETFVAAIVSAIAAGLSLILIVFLSSSFVGVTAFKLGLLSDEGRAWFGISFGIPVGLVCAIFVFVYCFRKIRRYGQADS